MRRPLVQMLLAIGMLLLANYYWHPGPSEDPDRQASDRGKTLPRAYIDDARSSTFTPTGALGDVLEARRLEQYGRRAYTLVTAPRFYSHSRDGRSWSASADRGRYEEGRERLLLRENVVLTHDQTGVRLESSALDIRLDSGEAQTTRAVTITQGENRTIASGMIARLNEETMTLGPNVESTYVPLP